VVYNADITGAEITVIDLHLYGEHMPEERITGSKTDLDLSTFTCNKIVLFAVMLLFALLLSFTSQYFHYLFSPNIAYDLTDN